LKHRKYGIRRDEATVSNDFIIIIIIIIIIINIAISSSAAAFAV